MNELQRFEALLDAFIECDHDRAERWIQSQLAQIDLKRRLENRRKELNGDDSTKC